MGSLSGSTSILAGTETFNLASPVQTDWIEFHTQATPNRKSGAGSTIGLPTLLGSGVSWGTFAFGIGYTWTGGTPQASGTAVTEGIYVNATTAAVGQGYQFTLPADTTSRTVTIYWGANSCAAQLVATLSDGSATAVTHTPTATGAGNAGYYSTTLTYAANSASQTLTIACTVKTLQSGGNTWLGAAKYLNAAASSTGTAASAQAPNTASASGSVSVSGSAASAEVNDASAATGGVSISGAASSAQAANLGAASAGAAISGVGASTQAKNAGAASGAVSVSGSAASAQAGNAASASGAVSASGVASSAQAANTSSAAGAVAITGAASATQSPGTGSGTASNGSTESINGTTIPNNATQIIDASLAVWTLTGDGHAAKNGVNQSTGSASAYTLMLYWNHVVYAQNTTGEWRKNTATPWTVTTDPRPAAAVGSGSSTQAPGVSNAIGWVSVGGSAASAQAPNAAAATGSSAVSGSGASTQAPNVGNASGSVISVITGSASATQAPNTSAALGAVSITGAASAVQSANTASASGAVIDTSTPDPVRFTVPAERRTCVVARDPRRLPVAREARAARVTPESRRVIVPAEVRRITV